MVDSYSLKRGFYSYCRIVISKTIRKLFLPLIPKRLNLPFLYHIHLIEGQYENELKHLDSIVKQGDVAIDVGANQGLFTYKMSKHFAKVYAFEVNSDLTHDLSAYNPGNIEIIHKGLSSKDGNAILYIPVRNGLNLYGWASLRPNNCPDTQEHIKKHVQVCTLDSCKISSPSLIKIDVEGHELEVLTGAMQTLNRYRPTILVEVKDHNLNAVISLLYSLNYQCQKLEDMIRVTSSKENYIFTPIEC